MAISSSVQQPEADDLGRNEPDPRRWGVLGVMCLALLMVGIDGTIVNVALPSFTRELDASNTELQWIVDAYTIVFASFLLIAGNTGDRLGRKRCLVVGLLVFTAGSLGCSLAGSASALIVLRGVQGFGAAFVMPATLSIITYVFRRDDERRRAIALWAGVSGLGVAIGPLAGGYLLGQYWWGSIFLVNVPIGIATIVAVLAIVPESRDEHAPRLDLLGTVLVTVGLIAVLFGIIEGPSRGWTSPEIIGAFVAGVVLLTSFVLWENYTDHPILEQSFFRNPRFTAASIAITLVFFAMFGSLFFVSQYLQFVLGYSPLESGVRLLPVAVVLIIASPTSAKLVSIFGTKRVVAFGLALVSLALLIFSRTSTSSGYAHIAVVLVIVGTGMGLAIAPATDSIMGSVPLEKAGVGSAMNDTTREIGGALGVAILGSIAAAVYASNITSSPVFGQVEAGSPQAADAIKSSVGSAAVAAESFPAQVQQAIVTASNEAFVHSLDRAVLVGAGFALAGAIVALVFLPSRAASHDADDPLVAGAARRLGDNPAERRTIAAATLGLFADAGMSSLTYCAVAARSGVPTATLEHYWTSRVDAVAGALREIYEEHPVPSTGDLPRDLRAYVGDLRDVLQVPRARQVLGAVVAEAGSDPELAVALRERVVDTRRGELAARLEQDSDQLRVPVDVAIDQLVGPVYHHALILGGPIDDVLVDSVVAGVLR